MMNKKIITITLSTFLIISMYNYVFAKYKEEQYIQIAEVNIENAPRKKYTLKIYYMDEETNKAMKVRIFNIYKGDKYEVEILNFEGYTYLYSSEELLGIMEKNVNILLYYKKS